MTSGHVTRLLEESNWLSGLALRLVKDPSLADDLAQETLLSALNARRQPDADSTRGWLATILRRKVLGQKREDARRGYRQEVAARSEALPSAADVGALLESERLLRDALESLTEPYRRAVMLRYREGLSAAEIARRDGEPAGTVRGRVRTGLEMLRAQLEERDHNWAMLLVPIASLPSATASLAAKSAATTSTSAGAYLTAATAVALVGIPLAWNAMDSSVDSPAAPLPSVALDTPAPNGPPSAAAAEKSAPVDRVQLETVRDRPKAVAAVEEPLREVLPGVVELTVVDSDGQPISGAYAERWDEDHEERYSEESGANGHLVITPPTQSRPIREDVVLVRAPGWGAARKEMTFRAGSTVAHPEIVLPAAVRVHGTVHDPLDTDKQFIASFVSPLPEGLMKQVAAGSRLRDVDADLKEFEFLGAFEAVNRDTGEFMLNDVPAGSRGQVIVLHDDDGGRIGWSDVVELEAGSLVELDPIVLLAPAPERPKLAAEPAKVEPIAVEASPLGSTTIEVVDANGHPADSFEVQLLQRRDSNATAQKPHTTIQGSNGTASFTPLPFHWRLRIVAGGDLAELGPFQRDAFSGPSVIQLAPSIRYRGSVERIGRPLAGALLQLRQRSGPEAYFLTGEILTRAKPGPVLATAAADPRGAFEFPAMLAGEYVLAVHSGDDTCATFEVDAADELTLAVPGLGSVVGVVDARFGEVEGGILTASNDLGLRRSVTFGSDGVFRFDDLPEGLWRLGETYWPYGNEWLGEPDVDHVQESGMGPEYFYMTHSIKSLVQRNGIDVHVVAGETTEVRLPVQTTKPVQLTGRVHVDGRRSGLRNIHFQAATPGTLQGLIDQRWLKVGREGQFDVTLPSHGKWRVLSPWDGMGSSYWAEFDIAEGDAPTPLEVNFKTGTLILTGVSPDHPFTIVVKGESTPSFKSGANRPFMTHGAERRVLQRTLAGEVQIFPIGQGANTAPLKTGVLEPGATLELDLGW